MIERGIFVWLVVFVQVSCAAFFLLDMTSSFTGTSLFITWQAREALEIGASIGLILGAFLGVRTVLKARKHSDRAELAIRTASGAFNEVVEEHFLGWKLTPAEKEVAWLSIKGFSTSEIAKIRKTSEGTVKAQGNAIYRKANVSGRTQLLSILVEDLLLNADQELN
jgi:DNA-binding CsgD family transcriptional regulator